MKILYDYQVFIHNYGGASRYFTEVLAQLREQSDLDTDIALLFTQNIHLRDKKIYTSLGHYLPFKYKFSIARILDKINQLAAIIQLKIGHYDLFHPTLNDPYFLNYLNGKPYVITVHDMIYELGFLSKVPQKDLDDKRKLVQHAAKIVAVSHNTKNDLIRLLDVPEEKIEVIYHATTFVAQSKGQIAQKYILFTGNRSLYKNFDRFLEAVTPLLWADNDLYIRLTGAVLTLAEQEKIIQLRLTDKIIVESFVAEERLMTLYSNALCFVYPSLYEGFGIPLLEAFACECPIAISQTSCFPEVAADAALYFDPYDVADMRSKIQQLIENQSLRNQLISKGTQRLKAFSWEQTARQHEVLYKSL
jgi:glycosyltransferase involved in cell wall biosynthesis